MSEALFDSVHDALVFAFNNRFQQSPKTPMMYGATGGSGSGKGLGGLDGCAQAGFINREIRELGRLCESILIARRAPRRISCECRAACCSGFEVNPDWINSIAFIADHARTTALAGCKSNGLLRREYVLRYFGEENGSLEDIANRHDVCVNTVSAHNAKVSMMLGGIKRGKKKSVGLEELAFRAVEDRFMELGWISTVSSE